MSEASAGKAPGFSWVSPYLAVPDVEAALRFYVEAFGFQPGTIYTGREGAPVYADLCYAGNTLLIGLPGHSPFAPAPVAPGCSTVYCYTPDVSAHAARACRAGAQVLCSIEHTSWNDRLCIMTDPFGHRWIWATHKGVAPGHE